MPCLLREIKRSETFFSLILSEKKLNPHQRRPKLTIRGIDQILMVFSNVSASTIAFLAF